MSYTAIWFVYVPEAHLETYRQIWRDAIPVFEEHGVRDPVFLMPVDVASEKYGVGALSEVLKPPAEDEVLLVGLDHFDSREQCEAVTKAAMEDERMNSLSAGCVAIFGEDFTKSFFRGEYAIFE